MSLKYFMDDDDIDRVDESRASSSKNGANHLQNDEGEGVMMD